jgi:transposase
VRLIAAIFDIERVSDGSPDRERLALRHELGAPLAADLEEWCRAGGCSSRRKAMWTKGVGHMLKTRPVFTVFLVAGRI